MSDESPSPKGMDEAEERSRQHDVLMAQHLQTPEGIRDQFNSNFPVGAMTRLANIQTGEELTLSILGRAFLRGARVFFKALDTASGTCLEVELARGPDGRLGWVATTPDES